MQGIKYHGGSATVLQELKYHGGSATGLLQRETNLEVVIALLVYIKAFFTCTRPFCLSII